MRKTPVLIAFLTISAVVCTAAELTEFGFQLNLSLQPYRDEGRVSWWITVGAYGRITLSDEWRLRLVAGSGIPPLYPFADIELVRVYTSADVAGRPSHSIDPKSRPDGLSSRRRTLPERLAR